MNSKRSMWKLVLGLAGVGLLVTNCTIKTDTEDDTGCVAGTKLTGCLCASDNSVSYQVCKADGSYDACFCTGSTVGGGSNGGGSNGGASNAGANNSSAGNGGATTDGGASAAGEGGSAGEGGEGGTGPAIDPNDCYSCLNTLCTPEWDACAAEDENNPEDPENAPGNYCLSSAPDGTGQIEKILDCIDLQRKTGLVKRDAVRACASTIGKNATPNSLSWPPNEMTATTAGLLNCMADAPTETAPGSWADSNNVPTNGTPKPWVDMTCAKLSCTSAKPN